MAIFAIGDVHGRLDLLIELASKISAKAKTIPGEHTVITLGDYIDRGSDSKGVIDFLMEDNSFGPNISKVINLLGNHEQMLLYYLQNDLGQSEYTDWTMFNGGAQTLSSYIPTDEYPQFESAMQYVPKEHKQWLHSLPYMHIQNQHFFVHAGVNPRRSLYEQERRDLLHIRGEFHNYRGLYEDNMMIIHGHAANKKVQITHNRIGIDTGAVWTNKLTALIVNDDKTYDFLHTVF